MIMRFGSLKLWSVFIAAFLLAALPLVCPAGAQAAGAPPSRFIAIVYDDSGSMGVDAAGHKINNYIYANYSLQNLVALMEPRDSAKVYLFTKKGKDPVAVSRKKDLYNALKGVGAKPEGNTYADTVKAAMADGSAFLTANPNGEFLFVVVTDGDSMDDGRGVAIAGSLAEVFEGYLETSGLAAIQGRSKALLLSIGTGKPLAPVSDLQAVLNHVGIPTGVFTADITEESTAGDHIMAAMMDLAEAMASTNMMEIESGKPFTIRYPLESLVIMEQFRQSSESMVKSIEGQAGALTRTTLYSTKAIGGIKLASTVSSIKAKSGSIKPGSYTLQTTGKARLMVFSKVGFTPSVVINDGTGKQVAAYRNNKWSVGAIQLAQGEALSAKVSLVALDGEPVEMDSHVQMAFGTPECFRCEVAGQGAFRIEALKPGQDYLNINLNDPAFFQITLPSLPVTVPEPPQSSASPSPSESAGGTAGQQATATAEPSAGPTAPDGSPARLWLDSGDVLDAQYRVLPVVYTSSEAYAQAASISIGGAITGEIPVSFNGIPDGMQVRFNGMVFDGANLSGKAAIAAANTVEIWINNKFAASGMQSLAITVGDGQMLAVNLEPKPRQIKVELSQPLLEFGVLDRGTVTASCGYRVFLQQDGSWVELKASDLPVLEMDTPAGLEAVLDPAAQSVQVQPAWLAALAPVGKSALVLHAGTGKPGETALAAIEVNVRDDWRKWLFPGISLAAFGLLAAYALALARKRRIPLEVETNASNNSDMSGFVKLELVRNWLKRNLWPFGREVCSCGPLELYPHPKKRDQVILSSVAVQHGLLLDGKPPQHHKEKDDAGDFILSGDTIVAIRENGAYRHYRFTYHGPVKAKNLKKKARK